MELGVLDAIDGNRLQPCSKIFALHLHRQLFPHKIDELVNMRLLEEFKHRDQSRELIGRPQMSELYHRCDCGGRNDDKRGTCKKCVPELGSHRANPLPGRLYRSYPPRHPADLRRSLLRTTFSNARRPPDIICLVNKIEGSSPVLASLEDRQP